MLAAFAFSAAWSLQFQPDKAPKLSYQHTVDAEEFSAVSVIEIESKPRAEGGWIETSTVVESLTIIDGQDVRDTRRRTTTLTRNAQGLVLKMEPASPVAERMARLTKFIAPKGPAEPGVSWKVEFPQANGLPAETATYTLGRMATRSMPPQVTVTVSITQGTAETAQGTWRLQETTGIPLGFKGKWLSHPSVERPATISLERLQT